MMTMRKSVMVFQIISSENSQIFFITIGEKSSTNIPLRKMYRLTKSATLTYIYGPMYLDLNDYPSYSDKISVILRHTLTKN